MHPDLEREYVDYVSARLTRLHRTAYLLCGNAHEADDVVQTTLTSLYVHWKRAQGVENLDGYVHRIMVRRFLDERRHGWTRVLLGDRMPERSAADVHGVDERGDLVRALRELAPGQRAVLVLRYFGDLSVEATAQALECSTGNVKSQSARGLATLRTLLDEGCVAAIRGAAQ